MSRIINLLTSTALLVYSLFLLKSSQVYVGGSLIFIIIIGFLIYFSIIFNEFALAFSLLSFIILSIMTLNFCAAYEYLNGYSTCILISNIIIASGISILIYFILQLPLESRKIQTCEKERIEFKKRIHTVLGCPIVTTVAGLLVLAVDLSSRYDFDALQADCLPINSYICMVWIIIGMLFLPFSKWKWRFLDSYISAITIRKSNAEIIWLRKWFWPVALAIFLLGCGLEIGRGFWILWLLSWLSFVAVCITIWQVWRFVFNPEYAETKTDFDMGNTIKLPYAKDIKFAIRFYLLNFILLIIQVILLSIFRGRIC